MDNKNVLHGPSPTISPAVYSTGIFMYQRLLENIHKGDLFINEIRGDRLNHADFLQYSCRLADSLANYGINSNNIAAICSENNIAYFIPIIACLFKGIPMVPVNPIYTESELSNAFELTKPDIVFCSALTVNKILDLQKRFTNIETIIVVDSNEEMRDVFNLSQFIHRHSNYVNIYEYKPTEIEDIENHIAFIMFSSGTTGLPKGVMITHKNVNVKNATFLEPSLNMDPNHESKYVLSFLPYFHAFGLQGVITAMMKGRTIVILERFDFASYLQYITKYKITTLSGAPPIMQLLAKSPLVDKYDLSHVEEIRIGAGPVSETLEKAVKNRVGIKKIGQGYGMTESTIALTITPVGIEKHGSCGKLLPHLSAVVKDLKTGQNLGPNQDGELCFKGGVIMKGYYKSQASNEEIFTKDGYMRTGDIGHYDEDGFFYIIDRLKELIKYKGYQVPPAELEGVLLTNPKIKEAAVVGLPDADAGELPLAFVVKQPGVVLTEQEVVEYVKKFVAPTKYLRGGVIFIQEIPKNPSGKILRRDLRDMLKSFKAKL